MLLLALIACGPRATTDLVVYVPESEAASIETFVRYLDWPGASVETASDPVSAAADAPRRTMAVAVALDLDCTDCYKLSGEGDAFTVHAGDRLGAQYGLAALLEEWGFRFNHPFRIQAPPELVPLDPLDEELVEPDMAVRGLHLHTLHPIEPLWGFWSDDPSGERASRVIDWTIKNRGNFLQWVALDDILQEPEGSAWQERTAAVLDELHGRGLTAGIGVQLFGSSNLQLAYDLVDDVDIAEQSVPERLAVMTDQLDFDHFSLSFGEFFGEEPDAFLALVDYTYAELQAQEPGATMSATIHVGDSEDQTVTYDGEEMQYYFLAQFADPAITPWVHTVMFYDLFEDAGLAYHHEEFDDHRAFLLERLEAGLPVGYHPESAYWVAFDNPVPLYLPLYMRSRWLDMREIEDRAEAGGYADLQEHILFSTGWEWGYWQNDAATLRMNYYGPGDDWGDVVRDLLDDDAAADVVVELGEIQHEYLLEKRLIGYLAGRDAVMDVGYQIGVVSQPQRVTLTELAAMSEADAAAFELGVISPLADLSGELAGLSLSAGSDPWRAEIRDGVEITQLRARFAHATYAAVAAHAAGGEAAALLADAQAAWDAARIVVDRRHSDMHDPEPDRLLREISNPTIYDYGYLIRAEELCFWEREYLEAVEITTGAAQVLPSCAF